MCEVPVWGAIHWFYWYGVCGCKTNKDDKTQYKAVQSTLDLHSKGFDLGHWALVSCHVQEVGVRGLSGPATLKETDLQSLQQCIKAQEFFYLSTCNRVEFLFYSPQAMVLSEMQKFTGPHGFGVILYFGAPFTGSGGA